MAHPYFRLFVAIPLPERIVQSLRQLACPMHIPPNLHLTLRFIGNVPAVEPYIKALAGVLCPKPTLEVNGFFQLKKSLTAAQVRLTPELELLKSAIDTSLNAMGIVPDDRKFLPHITLSRKMAVKRLPDLHLQWQPDFFCLYQSLLKPAGAVHKVILRVNLI